jgi:hypothetical protein
VSTLDEQQPRSERLHVFSIIMFLVCVRVGYTTASADVTRASPSRVCQDGYFSLWVGLSCYTINRNV